ncbi:MAG: FAD:protein FMN transferase [Proteobacteria bacterium]|nr:FAD:protein FMN transferase [Pseudomonadota bacterium]
MHTPRRTLTRRRFLSISAGLAALVAAPRARAGDLYVWRGTALGAEAVIRLPAGPDAARTAARAAAEVARLETIFSLYQPGSALSALNRTGGLEAPPFELLECLALAGRVHAASGGRFDPTIQPLWALYAERYAAGTAPRQDEIGAALALTGWPKVGIDEEAVTLAPGMGLTLNGIAQGFIADRVAAQLRAGGYGDLLVNTGEYRAIGGTPSGGDWPLTLAETGRQVALRDRALATSAPLGTTFDQAGSVGHILDPLSGRPAPSRWRAVSVSAPEAAVADALSTAACLMADRDEIARCLAAFPGARLEELA